MQSFILKDGNGNLEFLPARQSTLLCGEHFGAWLAAAE
jgi:hypothetical protein